MFGAVRLPWKGASPGTGSRRTAEGFASGTGGAEGPWSQGNGAFFQRSTNPSETGTVSLMWSRKLLVTAGMLTAVALGWWLGHRQPGDPSPPANVPAAKPSPPRQPQRPPPTPPQPPPGIQSQAPGYAPPFLNQGPPQVEMPGGGWAPLMPEGAPQRQPRFRPLTQREKQRIEESSSYEPAYRPRPGVPGESLPSGGYGQRQDYGFRRPDPQPGRPSPGRAPAEEPRDGGYPEPAPAFGPSPWPQSWPALPPERYPHRDGGARGPYAGP